jgi:hypothetical protein
MVLRRVIQPCADLLFYECGYHASVGSLLHVDVHVFESGGYLGAWSIEGQKPLDDLKLTFELIACLEQHGYKLREA